MAYVANDPRSQPATRAGPAVVDRVTPRPAQYREIDAGPADQRDDLGSKTWWMRSQALVVGYTRAKSGDRFERPDTQSGDYMVITLDDSVVVEVHHELGGVTATEPSVVVVPAGVSAIEVREAGSFVQIFAASTAPDLASKCVNAAEYADRDPNVAEFVTWPDPTDGLAVRLYLLADYPIDPKRLPRRWSLSRQCSSTPASRSAPCRPG